MGLIPKSKKPIKEAEQFTEEELEFIVKKLRTAEYKGHEFELFFNVLKKITDSTK